MKILSIIKGLFGKTDAKTDVKKSHILQLVIGLVIIIFLNVVGFYFFSRLDLTSEKRYTLSKSTKHLLKNVDDIVFIRCYLEGEIPADYKRLRNETKEMINQFRSYNKNIEFEFLNPNDFKDKKDQAQFYQRLFEKGFQPILKTSQQKDGQVRQYMFPYLEISYKGETKIISLISTKGTGEQEILNSSVQNLEYNIYSALRGLTTSFKNRIAIIRGHGELDLPYMWDFISSINEFYAIDTITLGEKLNVVTDRVYDSLNPTEVKFRNIYKTLIIANPTSVFSYKDFYILDQFVMHGGRILWLVDPLQCSMDSIQNKGETYAITNLTGVNDPLFRYGARLNTNLVMDMQCSKVPIITGVYGDNTPQFTFYPWNFFPVLSPNSNHIISEKINPVKMQFASSIDTIQNNITKTPLLTTSNNTRIINAPAIVSLEMLKQKQDPRLFNLSKLNVAMLLEGKFISAFKHRLAPEMLENQMIAYKETCDTTNSMIVVADGDIIRNDYVNGQPLPLGYDRFTREMYGNKEFLINCVNYLCGDEDMIPLRSREVAMRKLDSVKAEKEKTFWQIINIGLPIIIVLIMGFVIHLIRKRKYIFAPISQNSAKQNHFKRKNNKNI
ncbi:MAG: gliding motility-associated ABC transporter substrate-binding protein GldG [Bacteroidia bacterium]|nr:gliding motility-associated ABC transporter substrate-binding protein GldG [Bacteroidales bacterium]NCC18717.1 gliding motility-associated ABC transporter substrate-binding protein GldG [Bacteroidia bacterium]